MARNEKFFNLSDPDRAIVEMSTSQREKYIEGILNNDVPNDVIIDMCRCYNGYNGGFDFCDTFEFEEFMSVMDMSHMEFNERLDFMTAIVNAANAYEGKNIESAEWGYEDDYDSSSLRAIDACDLEEEAKDHTDELAYAIIDDSRGLEYSDVPEPIAHAIELWDRVDGGEFDTED